MAASWDFSLSSATDEQLRDALAHAHIPSLLASLVHLNGNTDFFNQVTPAFDLFSEEEDGLEEPAREEARQAAFEALRRYRDEGCPELGTVSDPDVAATMHLVTGVPFEDEMQDFLREELNLYGEDRRRVDVDPAAIDKDFQVLIIGSGMSGILAAIRLKQQGIPFQILEKNPEIGGTWYENTYPGCQVDSANHIYNYIFEPNHQWPNHFSGAAELFGYFNRVAEKYGLRDNVRLHCSVQSVRYDEADNRWQVTVNQDGREEILESASVISAVGQLNSPKYPDIEGLQSFKGTAFHSARWEHQHDLSGKRVVVIGTGCSAVQFVPEIAPQCEQLTVFQRTPPWLLGVPEYHQPMLPEELWMFRELPFYARWYRFFVFRTRGVDGWLPYLYAEPGWQGPPGTIGEANEAMRAVLIEGLTEQVEGDEELLEKLIPDYPPGGKRPVLDDGSWVQTLKRDNVQLRTEAIARIVPEGIVTTHGTLHPADVLIFGTGFEANKFLSPMQVYGRDGTELVGEWGGNPHAYVGTVVPGFPNFYCLYGPNSNIVTGSSIIFFVECQVRYVLGCLKLQLEENMPALDCRREVMDSYNKQVDELNELRAWGSPVVSSWYKNSAGRVTQNWPGTHFEWWQITHQPNPEDYLPGLPALTGDT
jgi:4-hydroxyacetophenone monooxygenase